MPRFADLVGDFCWNWTKESLQYSISDCVFEFHASNRPFVNLGMKCALVSLENAT